MADVSTVSQTGAFSNAENAVSALEGATMHLFQGSLITPTALSTAAEFLAAEATFDGYSPSTIAEWSDPPVLAGQAWAIYAPTQTFRYTFSAGVVNAIGGYFILDSGGVLIGYTTFSPWENAASPGQAIIRTPVSAFPFGNV